MADETSDEADKTGRFAYGGLERVIHERARLSILASLAAHAAGVPFIDLRELCQLTDGNLSRQLTTLAEAGLVEVWKSTPPDGRPQTLARLTAVGRRRFADYVAELEAVVTDARAAAAAPARRGGRRPATS
jgi:DNA-binding transcriptional ArsR family regulator